MSCERDFTLQSQSVSVGVTTVLGLCGWKRLPRKMKIADREKKISFSAGASASLVMRAGASSRHLHAICVGCAKLHGVTFVTGSPICEPLQIPLSPRLLHCRQRRTDTARQALDWLGRGCTSHEQLRVR